MKVKSLYIGKIDTIIKIDKKTIGYYTRINKIHGATAIRIINREFSTKFCKYALLYYKKGQMHDVSNGKKYPYPEVINNYRSKKLQDRNVVSDYFEASELLPLDKDDNVSKKEAKMLYKQLNYNDIEKRFNEN